MASFRRFGGINRSDRNYVARSYVSSAGTQSITDFNGQANSRDVYASHVDLSGNSILQTYSIQFQDGSVQTTAYPGPSSDASSGRYLTNDWTLDDLHDMNTFNSAATKNHPKGELESVRKQLEAMDSKLSHLVATTMAQRAVIAEVKDRVDKLEARMREI